MVEDNAAQQKVSILNTSALQAVRHALSERSVSTWTPVWPDPLREEAFHGLAGEFVRAVEPHTEADPAALLFQFLAAFGVAAGRGAYFRLEADEHRGNLFVVVVGETSVARKGTSFGHVRRLLGLVDRSFGKNRIFGGLSSGEGLIFHVRDPQVGQRPVRRKGRIVQYQQVLEDPGVSDKRTLVFESEFSSVLRVCHREGNTLSAVLRSAWDSGDLRVLTRNCPLVATGAHMGIFSCAYVSVWN